MDIFFHHIAQKSGGHAQEKDGKAECPLGGTLGETDIVGDLLTENGPAVYRTDAAVQQQCRNGGTNPLVLNVFHKYPFLHTAEHVHDTTSMKNLC